MNLETLLRAGGLLMMGGSLIAVMTTIRSARTPRPIQPRREIVQVLVGIIGTAAVGLLASVPTPWYLAVTGSTIGLVLGLAQGRTLRVFVQSGRLFSARTATGLAVWGVSLVAMQAAALANRVAVVRLGQALAYLGIATTLGIMLSRPRSPQAGAGTGPAGAVAATALVLGFVLTLALLPVRDATAQPDSCALIPADFFPEVSVPFNGQYEECQSQSSDPVVQVQAHTTPASAEGGYINAVPQGGEAADIGERSAIAENFGFVDLKVLVGDVVVQVGGSDEGQVRSIGSSIAAEAAGGAPSQGAPADEDPDAASGVAGDDDSESEEDRPPEDGAGAPAADDDRPDESEISSDPDEELEEDSAQGAGDSPAPAGAPAAEGSRSVGDALADDLTAGEVDPTEAIAATIAAILTAVATHVLTAAEGASALVRTLSRAGIGVEGGLIQELIGAAGGRDAAGTVVGGLTDTKPVSTVFEPLPPSVGPRHGEETPFVSSPWTVEPPPADAPAPAWAGASADDAPGAPRDEAAALDDATALAEPADDDSPSLGEGEPPAGVSPREIEDVVAWGQANNRTIEDIQQDLDGLHGARGGVGSVPLPEGLGEFDHPVHGHITAPQADIDHFHEVNENIEYFEQDKQRLRQEMLEIQRQREQQLELLEDWGLRGVAGAAEVVSVYVRHGGLELGSVRNELRLLDILRQDALRADSPVKMREFDTQHGERWQQLMDRERELALDIDERLQDLNHRELLTERQLYDRMQTQSIQSEGRLPHPGELTPAEFGERLRQARETQLQRARTDAQTWLELDDLDARQDAATNRLRVAQRQLDGLRQQRDQFLIDNGKVP